MNKEMISQVEADEEILTFDVSDDVLERVVGRGPEGCHVGLLHARLGLLRVAAVAFSAPTASRY